MADNNVKSGGELVALGRLSAATRDAMGDTLGSFSGLALEPGSWRAGAGGFAGVLVALPDRGFNIPDEGLFSNFPTRVHRLGFELTGSTLKLEPLGTRYVRDRRGALTTGLDPGKGSVHQFGVRLPGPDKGPAKDRLSIDSEGIAIMSDGRFFISDEFGPNIYCCAADGRIVDVIVPPKAFVPYCGGKICFSEEDAKPARGRAPNDGFEGLSLSPDERELYVLLQSPLVQDRKGKSTAQRYTRLLVYDVSKTRMPRKPSAHYVLELPLRPERPDGPGKEAAEANDVVALGYGRFLILTRDGFGFGAKKRNKGKAIVFKRVMAGSLDGASNLAGSAYERKAKPIMKDGKLADGIRAAALETFIDIADESALNRVGLTLEAKRQGLQQMSAKWESLVLSPVLDPKRPRERLLFIGNDNDFRTREGYMPDGAYDGGFEHDNMILVYRIMLPG